MRSLFFILEKEFRQMRRRKGLIRTLFIAPIIQLILMPLAANYSVKNISLVVVDHDHSSTSREMVAKITSSGHFNLYATSESNKEALSYVEHDKADLVLEIPPHFERNLVRENSEKLSVEINAIEGVKAGLAGAYLSQILLDYNADIRERFLPPTHQAFVFRIIPIHWYNVFLNYYLYIIPGILVNLVTGIGLMQTAFNLVNEKEIGTIEQINVTPVKKFWFILGKLLPFYILSAIIFSVGLLVGFVFYGMVPVGSIATMYIALLDFLFALVGFGLLLSTYAESQQQVMSLAFFFMNILNMMSGLFTNLDSMPAWAQFITNCFPLSHFIKAMRMICLKGSGLADITPHLLYMFAIGLVFNTWAVLNYKKRS
ncbi:MAG: ABC transporter permease [Chitinophagaceae bacterium]|nr:ABC transporter permease [Chitinophagaceae bacterium]